MGALIGFVAFMAIVIVVFLAKTCAPRPIRKLTPIEEKAFEIDPDDVSTNHYVVDLLHHD